MEPTLCYYCWNLARWLCDHPAEGGTCDRVVCDEHRANQASGIVCSRGRRTGHGSCCQPFSVDYCPEHGEKKSVE